MSGGLGSESGAQGEELGVRGRVGCNKGGESGAQEEGVGRKWRGLGCESGVQVE